MGSARSRDGTGRDLAIDLARFAESYAPKHFSIMEFPLVIDPAVRRLVMLDKTPFWGAAYYRKTRQDAQELLAPP